MSSQRPERCVLVTSAGTATAFGVLRAARRGWGDALRLVGADINPPELVTGSLLCDAYLRLPPFAHGEYLDALATALTKEAVDTLIPISDPEIAIAAALAVAPGAATLRLPFAGREAARVANDKWAIHEACLAAGLPLPHSELLGQPALVENRVVKARSGFGSRGVDRIASGTPMPVPSGTIVQQVLRAPEVTIDAHRGQDGRVWTACRERIETRLGVATKCRVYQDAHLHSLATALLACFAATTICFQVMHDETGRPCITDVNFRTGGGTSMSACAGYDFHAAFVGAALGEDTSVHFGPFRPMTVTRQYSDFVMQHESCD
jgi:hypothetical protein